jgi:flagellar biosynthesis anti-sigma factor FlgM
MKIQDAGRLAQLSIYQQNGRLQRVAPSRTQEAQRDGVTISQEALRMARVSQEQDAQRAERLNTVKQMIQNGTYSVPADFVARKLLEAYGES